MRKPAPGSVDYTIRGIPPEVDHALRLRAVRQKKSLNRVVVEELTRSLIGKSVKVDFMDLVGQWQPDAGFDEIIATQRQIDAEHWK